MCLASHCFNGKLCSVLAFVHALVFEMVGWNVPVQGAQLNELFGNLCVVYAGPPNCGSFTSELLTIQAVRTLYQNTSTRMKIVSN